MQYLRPQGSKTFDEYARDVFIPHVESYLKDSVRVDVVWDSYKKDSLKSHTREQRGTGQRRKVVGSAPIPGDWQKFLRVDENKTELFQFLSTSLIDSVKGYQKEVIANLGINSVSSLTSPIETKQ